MAKISIFNEDCFETMKRMAERGEKVDIILTSPPYNTARTGKTQRSIDNYENRYDIHLDDMSPEQYADWTVRLFEAFDSILAPNGVVIYNISYGSESPESYLQATNAITNGRTVFTMGDKIIWKKKSALPNNVSHNKLTRITEDVFVYCRQKEYKTYNANKQVKSVSRTGQKYYENVFNFIEAANNDGPCAINKATFSTELVMKLLEIYATQNAVVYDPFMGTGTTAMGCEKYGTSNMVCYGSELSENQVAYANERIEKWRKAQSAQLSLFPELDEESNQ